MGAPETYTRHRATSDRILNRWGGTAYLVREGEPGGTEWEPEPGEDELHAVSFIETGYALDHDSGTLIAAGDLLGIFAVPADIIPTMADRFQVNGAEHVIIDLKPIQPAPGAPVLQFAIHARR